MVFLIRYFCDRYFRCFDSGDFQGKAYFRNVYTVAKNMPEVMMWAPTKEFAIVRAWNYEVPDNLVLRVSGAMIDGPPPGLANYVDGLHRGAARGIGGVQGEREREQVRAAPELLGADGW